MSNSAEGTRFEQNFCRLLADDGFWVHRIEQTKGGQQPADIIAMKGGAAYLIDCKICSDSRFRFSRMEPNQRTAMDRWLKCGGTAPKFALRDAKGRIWMLDYQWAVALEESGAVSVPCAKHSGFLILLTEWIEWCT